MSSNHRNQQESTVSASPSAIQHYGPPGALYWMAFLALTLRIISDLYLCPHSKVEESFQLQATHDMFYVGISPAIKALWGETPKDASIALYDHWKFPGVVPRTFAGPSVLAACCHVLRIVILPSYDIANDPMLVQFLARLSLAAFNLFGWYRLSRALNQKQQSLSSSRYAGHYLLFITASQFHLCFYASRMLPNTFALAVILHAITYWLQGGRSIPKAATAIVFGTAIFRCDMLLLLFSLGLSWLIRRELTVLQALRIGVVTGVVSLLLTCPLDSIMWKRLLWPEGQVFYYNTVLGKSSDWGTSPWHWYVTSAIPKAMLFTAVLVPFSFLRVSRLVAFVTKPFRNTKNSRNTNHGVNADATTSFFGIFDGRWLEFFLPAAGFIFLYSFLAHKELRFMFPVLPILNMLAAVGMDNLHLAAFPPKKQKVEDDHDSQISPPSILLSRFAYFCGLMCIATTMMGSLVFVAVSRQNYPGGEALQRLSQHIYQRELSKGSGNVQQTETVKVYIDVASAMSGVSLFGQRAAASLTPGIHWKFEKGGYEEENEMEAASLDGVTHILSENPSIENGTELIATIPGNPSISIRQLSITTQSSIYVLERRTQISEH